MVWEWKQQKGNRSPEDSAVWTVLQCSCYLTFLCLDFLMCKIRKLFHSFLRSFLL